MVKALLTLGVWALAQALGQAGWAEPSLANPSQEPTQLEFPLADQGVEATPFFASDLEPTLPTRLPGLNLPERAGPGEILAAFLGLPFRVDGVISDQGTWSTWADPRRTFTSPGLNCSGLVASAGRYLLGVNLALADLKKDRQGDSGPESPLGQDWDFGLDVALNLAEGHFLRYLPEPLTPALSLNQAKKPVGWGLDIHSPEFLGLLGELNPERWYIFVISKPDRRFKGGLSYYHLGLGLVGPNGEIWLHHVTAKAGSHRLNLANKTALATFRRYFPPPRNGGERRILFLELAWPTRNLP
ncbi:MAG: hypothetical protein LBR11_04880 [Deltaproteobacteria bacterium]|jgi:hypothetical protein|nr:hypothetical protein [Deltaproteobacteria bacterium]